MPILLLHSALTVVRYGGGVQAGEAEGLEGAWTPRSVSVLVLEPLAASLPDSRSLRGPFPALLSTTSLTGSFGGGFCFSAKEKKKKKKHSAL